MRSPRIALALATTLAAALLGACSLTGLRAAEPTATYAAPSASDANPSQSPSASSPGIAAPRHDFSQAALDYFSEIALSAEYGEATGAVRKWTTDVKIAIHGDPTAEDRAALDGVIADLNALIGSIDVSIVRSGANSDMYFAPESDFSSISPEYVPTNMGFFWTWWGADGSIDRSRILISETGVTQTERDHLIREELTQSLGLMNDSYSHVDSMFYQGWTSPTKYSALDEDLITMLYLPEITSGMGAEQALAVLRAA